MSLLEYIITASELVMIWCYPEESDSALSPSNKDFFVIWDSEIIANYCGLVLILFQSQLLSCLIIARTLVSLISCISNK